jgi:hypothetical protein
MSEKPDELETFIQRSHALKRAPTPHHLSETLHPARHASATNATDFEKVQPVSVKHDSVHYEGPLWRLLSMTALALVHVLAQLVGSP